MRWHFGDPANPTAGGWGAEAEYSYPAAGDYQVRITFGAGLPCADTLILPITVRDQGPIQPAFNWDYALCSDTLVLDFSDQTTGAAISSYAWYVNDELFATEAHASLGLSGAGRYPITLVTTAANGCQDTIREFIEPRFIELTLADSLIACPSEEVRLYPQADTTFTYAWSPAAALADATVPNPLVTATTSMLYRVTITDEQSSCQREARIWVEIPPDIAYDLIAPATSCAPEVNLQVNTTEQVSAAWYADAERDSLLAETLNWQATVDGPTTYYLVLTDDLACQKVDSITIDGQAVRVRLEEPPLLCRGDSVRLSATAAGTYPIVAYSWSPEAYILSGATTPSPWVSPPTTTPFTLSLTNSVGCQLDTTIVLEVTNTVPLIAVTPTRDTILPGELVQLNATLRFDLTYAWSPATSLDAADVYNPVASPENTTLYTLVVTDRNGCTATDSSLIVVLNSPCRRPYVFVPTAFSPNGDQLNDELRVAGNVIDEFFLAIYNRWGEEVFSTRDQREGWDGTYRGKALPSDVYGYYLEVRCVDGVRFQDKGNISLLR
ncbi:MAG: gliding motility-associated C-terminal domain-containing protein [Bacteroidetes bacterium]|nr:MAG: gliding motility-associated C-terminal domain-containing protein [Bacteroidota bacterium]